VRISSLKRDVQFQIKKLPLYKLTHAAISCAIKLMTALFWARRLSGEREEIMGRHIFLSMVLPALCFPLCARANLQAEIVELARKLQPILQNSAAQLAEGEECSICVHEPIVSEVILRRYRN